jgi:putative transposase
MQLGYSYRLHPTLGQREALAWAFACARVALDNALRARQAAVEAAEPYTSDAELSAQLMAAKKTPERAQLGGVYLEMPGNAAVHDDELAAIIHRSLGALR